MKATLTKHWVGIKSSYWFIPTLLAVAAAAAAQILLLVDQTLDVALIDQTGWLFANQPQGARALLSAIAGSMITVAGVTFSVTISALAFASAQFGPRLLTNFMQDRGNQITLGTFIATFIYCLLVLRTVRGAEEARTVGTQAGGELAQAFVPHIAVLGAILLALASVAVLIYFIHHVPAGIHVSKVAARIGGELEQRIQALPPLNQSERQARPPNPEQLRLRRQAAAPVRAAASGYLQQLDIDGLVAVAERHDLVLFVTCHPGEFAINHQPLLLAWPPGRADSDAQQALSDCFAFGEQRTQSQDMLFLARELVEIAARALSPGVNDPFTAIDCMNWLGNALANLAVREPESEYRYGSGHNNQSEPRVMLKRLDFSHVATFVFDQLLPYVACDRNATVHALKLLATLSRQTTSKTQQTVIDNLAQQLFENSRGALSLTAERAAVERCFRHEFTHKN